MIANFFPNGSQKARFVLKEKSVAAAIMQPKR
jgi:hypothetical protein